VVIGIVITYRTAISYDLEYIFRDNIVNKNIKRVIDVIIGLDNNVATKSLCATYSGREFNIDICEIN